MMRTTGLLQATWRGIPFFIKSEGMSEAGRRIILHDYPHSNKRYVEDLGEIPPKFKLDAFVTGEDFSDRATQLENALKEKGRGTLTMPVFGSVSLFALPYRKDASQQSVGEIRFELEFVRGEPVSGPVQAESTTETVYAAGDDARTAVGDALQDKWIIPWDYATSFVSQFDLQTVLNSIMPFDTIVSNVTKFTQVVGYIQLNIASAIQTAIGLKTTLVDNLFQTISEGLSSGLGFTSLLDLIGFGSGSSLTSCQINGATSTAGDVPLWPNTTTSRKDRNTNRLNMVNTVRVCALITGYEQLADKTYSTVEEIEQAREAIEEKHSELMRKDTSNGLLIQSTPTVRKAVEKLRIAALNTLKQKEQITYNTTVLYQKSAIPVFILAYQLYAEEGESITDKAIALRALNPEQLSTGAVGNITVLQS
jgi:prophage DNA circulation protein